MRDLDIMVKVCGMTRQQDATLAEELGAKLLGFIFHPKSPRNVTPEQAAAITTTSAMRVGVFVKQSVDEICDIMVAARLDLAQLHGDQDSEFCAAVGGHRVMRAFWPQRYASQQELLQETSKYLECTRFMLLDSGSGGGGHGESMDWTMLNGFLPGKSWFLAGGLAPENIGHALTQCDPCGLDLNSGLESAPGLKDADKMRAAFANIEQIIER